MSEISERVDALVPGGDVADKQRRVGQLRTVAAQNHSREAMRRLQDAVAQYVAGDELDVMAAARAVTEARALEAAQQELFAAADALSHQLRGEAEVIQERSTHIAIAFLGEQLDRVVAEVAELDLLLGSATTATDAIRSGFADQWGRLDQLIPRYDEIRAQQARIYRVIAGVNDVEAQQVMLRVGLLADALTATPEIRDTRISNAYRSTNQYTSEVAWIQWLRSAPAPLVDPLEPGTWWPLDKPRYLRAICTQARPWVPTWERAAEVGAATYLATAETTGSGDTSRFVEARDRLPQLTDSPIDTTYGVAGPLVEFAGSEDFAESFVTPGRKARR